MAAPPPRSRRAYCVPASGNPATWTRNWPPLQPLVRQLTIHGRAHLYVLALATDYDGTLASQGVVDAATLAALERFKATEAQKNAESERNGKVSFSDH